MRVSETSLSVGTGTCDRHFRRAFFLRSSGVIYEIVAYQEFFAWSVATTKLEQSRRRRKRKQINELRGLTKENKNSESRNNTIVALISKIVSSLMTIVATRILGVTLRIHEPL